MSRPLLDQNRFTSRELAVAAELTPRNMALLVDSGLAPDPVDGGGGRGNHRSYDSIGLGALTLVGAFYKAGMELLVAARLAGAMTEEYALIYGRLPSNLAAFLQRPHNPRPGYWPWGQALPGVDLDDDYWLHNRLRCHSEVYQPWVALRGDMVVEIVDQTYVLTKSHDLEVGILSPVGGAVPASPDYRIEGRGSAARIVPIHEGIRNFDFSVDRESADAYRAQQERYLRARENAVTCLRVNVALAIRNGLDRVTDERAARALAA